MRRAIDLWVFTLVVALLLAYAALDLAVYG
jgi:hypothetical protein